MAAAGLVLGLPASGVAAPADDGPLQCFETAPSGGGASAGRMLQLLLSSYDWRNQAGLDVSPRTEPPAPGELEKTARGFLGVPYAWGGVKECGFDCSGFTNRVYALNGYDLPRTSREQFKVGVEVDPRDLRRGDLVFFATNPGESRITHVGMYLDGDTFIHAARGKGEVGFDRLSSRYYAQRLVGARRLLALPPGRYSTPGGTARSGFLVRNTEQLRRLPVAETASATETAIATEDRGRPEPSPEQPPPGLVEHAEDERPAQLAASTSMKGTITRAGPDLLIDDATALGIRVGAGYMNGAPSLLAVPELTWFGHANALKVALAAPFHLSGGARADELAERTGWRSLRDWSRIIREISYGTKDADLFVDLGRTGSGTLGSGQLMRYFTPNIASRYVPQYALEADALSLAFDMGRPGGGFELFIDDLLRPEVLGFRVGARPFHYQEPLWDFLRPLTVSMTYAGDWRAPYVPANPDDPAGGFETRRVHALGATAELPLMQRENLGVQAYLDASALWHESGLGTGSALGVQLRSDTRDRRPQSLRIRLEGRLSSPTFIPTYFDATYRLQRSHAPARDPEAPALTRLALLDELVDAPARWSVYTEANYQYMRSIIVGAAFESGSSMGSADTAPAAFERVNGSHLMTWVGLRNRYVPGTRQPFSAHLAYHLRNFHGLGGLFSGHRPNEYLFATVSVHLNRYLSVGGSLRKALDPERVGRSALDVVIDASLHYEL